MKKILVILAAMLLVVGFLGGCTAKSAGLYKNGVYQGKSEPDTRGNYSEIKITVKGGKIIEADFKGYLKDGTVKDENYGKTAGEEKYKTAQTAVAGAKTYGPKLVEVQEIEKVDAVSGATASYAQFKDAAGKALKDAKK